MEQKPHIVLHFDVNRTIVCIDGCQAHDVHITLNVILSKQARGRVDEAGTWTLVSTSLEDPVDESLPTFYQYVSDKYPGNDEQSRARRDVARQTFTDVNSPGSSWAPLLNELKESLIVDGKQCFIMPAFFHVVAELVLRKQDFAIVFRTFGSDAPEVIAEFNRFCDGTHPIRARWPNLPLLDGSAPGVHDMRVGKTGSFYRSDDSFAFVPNTLTFASEMEDLNFDFERWQAEHKDAQVYIGDDALTCFWELTSSRNAVVAIRDYWQYWNDVGSAEAGKAFYVNLDNPGRREAFFDDHIKKDDADIVDFRVGSALSNMVPAGRDLWDDHLVPVNSISVIRDVNFFIDVLRKLKLIT